MFSGDSANIAYVLLRLAVNTTTVYSVQQERMYSLINLKIWFYLMKHKATTQMALFHCTH